MEGARGRRLLGRVGKAQQRRGVNPPEVADRPWGREGVRAIGGRNCFGKEREAGRIRQKGMKTQYDDDLHTIKLNKLGVFM